MKLLIHDTLKREKVEFVPRPGQPVTMYVCGPTVYNYAHIGNARPVVVFDVLFRLLRAMYGEDKVIYARNITDVDDKINKKAMDDGVDISVITNHFADIYNADMAALNALPPTHQPRATAHMDGMVALIERLIEQGVAYVSAGEVLFDVAKYDAGSGRYGKLSGRLLDDMVAGARVEVAENKDNAADFVLWKPSKPGEPVWPGPRGLPGRPGWHIECSAMSEAVLGLPIDIHGGGQDLIFPHHTNEIAQSCAAHGHGDPAAYARYWMHNGFLDFSGEKMSKSLGNVVLVHDLVKSYPGEVIRWALLSGHYRSPLDWTPELLEQSKNNLDTLYQTLRDSYVLVPSRDLSDLPKDLLDHIKAYPASIAEALCDDLNTHLAASYLFGARSALSGTMIIAGDETRAAQALLKVKAIREGLLGAGALLGFLQQDPEAWFKRGADEDLTATVDALIAARITARAEKNWPEADRIRKELDALNVDVMDSPTGATWKMKVT